LIYFKVEINGLFRPAFTNETNYRLPLLVFKKNCRRNKKDVISQANNIPKMIGRDYPRFV
jgi:hypothetical protein